MTWNTNAVIGRADVDFLPAQSLGWLQANDLMDERCDCPGIGTTSAGSFA